MSEQKYTLNEVIGMMIDAMIITEKLNGVLLTDDEAIENINDLFEYYNKTGAIAVDIAKKQYHLSMASMQAYYDTKKDS